MLYVIKIYVKNQDEFKKNYENLLSSGFSNTDLFNIINKFFDL